MSSTGVRGAVCTLMMVMLASAPGSALAQSATPTIGLWLPGPGASGDPTYAGVVDPLPAGSTAGPATASVDVRGWVIDSTAQGWSGIDNVQLWDGLMGMGGHELGQTTFQLNRPDVAAVLGNPDWAASGFSATLSTSSLPPGAVTLYVYAHTPAKGWWYTQQLLALPLALFPSGPELNILTPTPLATAHASKTFTARGYALDRAAGADQGTGVDRVQLYLNGDRKTGIYLGDATLGQSDATAAGIGGQFATAGWQLTFQPGSWLTASADNQVTPLYVYAHSSVTGRETQTRVDIVISVP